ncbi:MAG: hypothetical protein HQ582_23205 [Planctomycetes bacterium]|nr:hypothetical protein [Planctomycetota bacterium]
MKPEIIANLWSFNGAFASGQLIYQVGIRLYMATGSDDEKTAMLRALAPWDFHLADVFPPSPALTTTVLTLPGGGTITVQGVLPAGDPGPVMDRFDHAFDGASASRPEHPSAGGIRRAPLDLTNLLNVHTPVDVDENGNMTARTSDPELARKTPVVAANLWAFANAKSACVDGLAGRAYLLAGRPTDLVGMLRNLAGADWLLARRLPVPGSFSATMDGQAMRGRADVSVVSSQQDLLFAPVLEQIEQEIPVLYADWEKKKTQAFVLRRNVLERRAHVVREDADGRVVVSRPKGTKIMMECSCGKKLSAPVSAAGKKAHCPACNKELLVRTPLSSQGNIATLASEIETDSNMPFEPIIETDSNMPLKRRIKTDSNMPFKPMFELEETTQYVVLGLLLLLIFVVAVVLKATTGWPWYGAFLGGIGIVFGPLSVVAMIYAACATISQCDAPRTELFEDRTEWDYADYSDALAALVGELVQWEMTGLEHNKEYVRGLGEEINTKFGFKGMQKVWHEVYAMRGPQATSDLTRIWAGVGRWQK